MQIACDQCGARYAVEDADVRGKAFKVRCTECSALIVARCPTADDEDWHFAKLKEPFLKDIETVTGDARSALVFSQIAEAREILSERGLAGVEAHVAALAARDLLVEGDYENADAVVDKYALDPLQIACEAAGVSLRRGQGDRAADIQARYGVDAPSDDQALEAALKEAIDEIAGRQRDRAIEAILARRDREVLLAARAGDEDVVRAVLERPLRARDDEGWTALMIAAAAGHAGIVKLLIGKGAATEDVTKDGVGALHLAAESGREAVVDALCDAGAAVDVRDSRGRSPLYRACRGGHTEVAERLLAHEASTDLADSEGVTPLSAAAARGHLALVRLLVEKGAKLDVPDVHGMTELVRACYHGHTEAAAALLELGASVEPVEEAKMTPLAAACLQGDEALVSMLLDKGAEVDGPNRDGVTPLIAASLYGRTEIARLLLDRGADVLAKAGGGWTALTCATEKGHAELVELLEERSGEHLDEAEAELMADDAVQRDQALIDAARRGDLSAAEELLAAGADPTATNKYGWTALMEAASEGHREMVVFLRERGARG